VTAPGRLGSIVHRAFGRFHRDAQLILATSLVTGAAISLWWIDFNLYLQALGLSTAEIGLVATIGSVAGGLVAFPASAASDRFGRRTVFAAGIAASLVALGVLVVAGTAVPLIVVAAALWSAGNNSVGVVVSPFLAEHSEPEHRNELFAVQFAIQNLTNVVAAILGGVVATVIAASIGLDPAGPGVYRIILGIMALLLVAGLVSVRFLTDDRPRVIAGPLLRRLGEPAAFPPDPRRRTRFGITIRDRGRFVRILFPGFLISLGAGQVIPFLNLFVRGKFGLDLAELNAVFAVTALGTIAAILVQPRLARRFGQITSVVIVQGASIPFLVVLGFSPVLWLVVLAMTVRSSLMNAGNPIFNAFAMEHVDPAERATLSAAMSVLWQLGWVFGGVFYSVLQATVGFDAGYTVNFVAIIGLYTTGTALTWWWFHDTGTRPVQRGAGSLATGR
jgi:MFS family permease